MTAIDKVSGPTPDDGQHAADAAEADGGPIRAADGRPLKASLRRALRREKLRALMLIAPLLIFIVVTFIAPIADMLFRSVENDNVSEIIPRSVIALDDWDYTSGDLPDDDVFGALARDLMIAAEEKEHTKLGIRLNYERNGMVSLLRKTGRAVDEIGELYTDQFTALDPAWEEPETWVTLMADPDWIEAQAAWDGEGVEPAFQIRSEIVEALPRTAEMYAAFARVIQVEDEDSPTEEEPWNIVYASLYEDLAANPDAVTALSSPLLTAAAEAAPSFESMTYRDAFAEIDEDWVDPEVWGLIQTFSSSFTAGYFLKATDRQLTPTGPEKVDDNVKIYGTLFWRTIWMSLTITFSCILLGYPIAYLLSNLPDRQANLLMILVLLPFWTSLLVRTSAWKVLLQQQGVINDIFVAIGLVPDEARLALINNITGTVIAMTHILLPFMILPLYSVMKGINPSYVRAAKSLGATGTTAFRRVYFPQSVPGIGVGSILVFILSIGYYITPEIVGGTKGVFISNRIAYFVLDSPNWGLAAALGTILLAVVLILYWCYDRIVGIDNVKLGG